jgi:hypothetical protein
VRNVVDNVTDRFDDVVDDVKDRFDGDNNTFGE